MTTVLPSVSVLEMTYRCNHACRFCSCPWFAGMLKPGPEMEVDEWERLTECEEWMHYVRHDYLPKMVRRINSVLPKLVRRAAAEHPSKCYDLITDGISRRIGQIEL